MAFLIGTDEAGYGPNLGPLVITATAWRVPQVTLETDLYELLRDGVACRPADDDGRLAIGDSKTLFQAGGSLAVLERGVLASLRLTGRAPQRWREVFEVLDPESGAAMDAIPWYVSFDAGLPRDATRAAIEQGASSLRQTLDKAQASLLAIRSTVVFPARFNDLVDHRGGKGAVLSWLTLSLVRQLVALAADEPVLVHCDKHGGRNRYGSLLYEVFPEQLPQVCCEGRGLSRYRWGPRQRPVEVQFVAKGDRCLTSALASMASKYLRELAMLALNDFWRCKVPGLKPTAGYPVDARRFRADIQAARVELGVNERMLWRNC